MSTTNIGGFGTSGSFNRQRYDRCAYQKDLYESTSPLEWQMYGGKFENCSKCIYNKDNFWRPIDVQIVDRESELKNITRRATRCPQFKYLPGCQKSRMCTSTFDPTNPVVMAQEVCPIVHNNIPRMKGPGYSLKTEPFCSRQQPVPVPQQQRRA